MQRFLVFFPTRCFDLFFLPKSVKVSSHVNQIVLSKTIVRIDHIVCIWNLVISRLYWVTGLEMFPFLALKTLVFGKSFFWNIADGVEVLLLFKVFNNEDSAARQVVFLNKSSESLFTSHIWIRKENHSLNANNFSPFTCRLFGQNQNHKSSFIFCIIVNE